MRILALEADERVASVRCSENTLSVDLMDGRTIIVPLLWYPRLAGASKAERENWQVCGGGYGIHWPDIDEDLSTEGLLRGAPSPEQDGKVRKKKPQLVFQVDWQKASAPNPGRVGSDQVK
jgi:hypothetical protein